MARKCAGLFVIDSELEGLSLIKFRRVSKVYQGNRSPAIEAGTE